MRYLIGVDLGTSGTKTVLFDENGTVIRTAHAEYPMNQPQNGYAVPLQKDGSYRELLNSDWECFGGSKKREELVYENGCVLDLSPFSAVLLVNG